MIDDIQKHPTRLLVEFVHVVKAGTAQTLKQVRRAFNDSINAGFGGSNRTPKVARLSLSKCLIDPRINMRNRNARQIGIFTIAHDVSYELKLFVESQFNPSIFA